MYIVKKKTPNSPRKSIQIVEGTRIGTRVQQKILAHVGVASNAQEEAQMLLLAQEQILGLIKQRSLDEGKELSDAAAKKLLGRGRRPTKAIRSVDLETILAGNLEEEYRLTDGVAAVGGQAFDAIFTPLLRTDKQNQLLKDLVLARLVFHQSKYKLCDTFKTKFDKSYTDDQIYRLMDNLYPKINSVKRTVFNKTCALSAQIDIVLFDVTTLYMESVVQDELREFGFSKDCKINNTQLVLALATNDVGLPIGYELFPGNHAEVGTLLSAINNWSKLFTISNVCFVGDRAMFSTDNIELIEAQGYQYIIAAKLRGMAESMQHKILNRGNYTTTQFGEESGRIADFTQASIEYLSCAFDGEHGFTLVRRDGLLVIQYKHQGQTTTPDMGILKSLQTELTTLRVITRHCKCILLTNEEFALIESAPDILADVAIIVGDIIVYNQVKLSIPALGSELQEQIITAGAKGMIANATMLQLFEHYTTRKYLNVPLAIITQLFPEYQVSKRRLCVSYKPSRAKNDAAKRDRILDRLKNKQGSVSNVIKTSAKLYMTSSGQTNLDTTKIINAQKWDGIHGVITNITDETAQNILERYSNLWKIEEAFRINKHNLRMRPVYHYKPERVHTHIALCYMTFAVLKLIQYQTQLTQKKLTIVEIQEALLYTESSIYVDTTTNLRYKIPGCMSSNAQTLYRAFGIKRSKRIEQYGCCA